VTILYIIQKEHATWIHEHFGFYTDFYFAKLDIFSKRKWRNSTVIDTVCAGGSIYL
jgi:hypothetical protein